MDRVVIKKLTKEADLDLVVLKKKDFKDYEWEEIIDCLNNFNAYFVWFRGNPTVISPSEVQDFVNNFNYEEDDFYEITNVEDEGDHIVLWIEPAKF